MTMRDDRHQTSGVNVRRAALGPHRSTALLALALAALALIAVSPAAEARTPHRGVEWRCTPSGIRALRGAARMERRVRCLLNGRRAGVGARPLRYNRCLDRAAERHARDMVRRRYFAHSSRGDGTPADRARAAGYAPRSGRWTVGENLGWGVAAAADPHAMVRAWMHSPMHRFNVLQPAYRDVGVAVVHGTPTRGPGRSRRARATYVVEFGARQHAGGCSARAVGRHRAARRPQRVHAHARRAEGKRHTRSARHPAAKRTPHRRAADRRSAHPAG
jgi:uncharacterized protein YkwD